MANYLFAGASSAIATSTAALLRAQGHRVIGISRQIDLQTYDESYTIADYLSEYPSISGNFEGLVYFPGTIQLKPFHRLSIQDFTSDYQINALGAVKFVQAYLKQVQNGTIVFVSSVAAKTGMPFHASVAMAKAALEGLTVSLAAELAPNIRVNCVAPSLTETPLAERFYNTPEKAEQMQKRNPLRKIGTSAEVAEVISFLLGPNSSWMTGAVLPIDGGMNNLKN